MDCDEEREGYVNPTRPAYPPIHHPVDHAKGHRHAVRSRVEEGIGLLITIAGAIWAVYAVTVEQANLWQLRFTPPGPVEICALGILLWLHAKWRHAAKAD